jgi:hypothetical protein
MAAEAIMVGEWDESLQVNSRSVAMLRRVGRTTLIALILFLGLITYLLIRESIARSKYQTAYPPLGKCDQPEVVIEAIQEVVETCLSNQAP